MDFVKIVNAVIRERRAQDDKWGTPQSLPDFQWLTILTEEVGEVAKAINEDHQLEIRDELVQVIAVAVKWLENTNY
jgi:NTP pyrophosphatase (non-canonical NTP hydrolase)